MDGERVAVVGASGFVGRAICNHLRAKEWNVLEVTRTGPASPTRQIVDVTDPTALRAAVGKVSAIINAAGRAHVIREVSADALQSFRNANVRVARSIARVASESEIPLYIEVSSIAAVTDESESIVTSATAPRPRSAYGISKLEAEEAVLDQSMHGGFTAVVLRPPMVYGPGMKGNPDRLVRLIRRGVPLPLGRVRNRRSVLYIENLVRAVHAILAAPPNVSKRFFVADAEPISTPDLIRLIAAGLRRRPRLISMPLLSLKALAGLGDQIDRVCPVPFKSSVLTSLTSSLVLDGSELCHEIGFRPAIPTTEGVVETARTYAKVA
jgi:nucleoside-diphosphate-sugar epimerase